MHCPGIEWILAMHIMPCSNRRIQELKLRGQDRAPKAPRRVGLGMSLPHILSSQGEGPGGRFFLKILGVKMAYFHGLLVLNFVFFL